MAVSTRYQRIRLILNSPWNQDGKTSEDWSVMFSLSGSSDLLTAEMEQTAIDLFDPFKQLCMTNSFLKHWSFYPIGGKAATGFGDYVATDHPCTHSAFATASELQQLEVCALLEAPVGKSATGKPKYLRKWCHNIVSDGSGNTIKGFNTGVTWASILNRWNTGCGPRQLRPVSPTDGTIGTWTGRQQLHVHQLRKGVKRKAPATQTVYVPVPIP